MIRGLIIHASRYTLGNLLVTVAGFISFPLFTRIFSVDEYGLMSLVATTLSLAIGLGKMGVQHSVVRYYAEAKAGEHGVSIREYYATVIGSMAFLGVCACALWFIVIELVPTWAWKDARVVPLMRIASVLVFVRIFESSLVNLMRAEQRSGLYSAYTVVRKYTGIAIIAGTVIYLAHGIQGFYLGTIAAEVLAVLVLGGLTLRHQSFGLGEFKPALFKSMLRFGIPMIGYEIGGVILSVGDRYVLQSLAGPEQLGYYSAAYNMCEYVQSIVVISVGQAVVPIYFRIWQEKGAGETIRFISRVMHFYLVLAVFTVVSMTALGSDFLAILASSKYLPGAPVVPWAIAGMVLDGCLPFVAAGIFLRKQTQTMMVLMLVSAVFNIGLNFALVPSLGIVGSGIATTLSYLLLTVAAMVVGHRNLPVPFPVATLVKLCAMGAVTYLLMEQVDIASHPIVEILVKGGIGVLAFAAQLLVLDEPCRAAVRTTWARLNAPGLVGA